MRVHPVPEMKADQDENRLTFIRKPPMSDEFESYRPLLFSIAYRMLGSVMDAEDVVQEAYIRYQAVPRESISALKPFLTTITSRLCLDRLKSAQVQRESYIGPWLPEPLRTDPPGSPVETSTWQEGDDETISMAFLVLLESLTPVERAVFVLREVFDFSYGEIGRIVSRNDAACRQIYHRAQKHIAAQRQRFTPSRDMHHRMLTQFLQMVQTGQTEALITLLAEDVKWYTDSGGKTTAARLPISGRLHVAQFLLGILRKRPDDMVFEIAEMNAAPAVLISQHEVIIMVVMIEIHEQQISLIRAIANPDKLAHLQKAPR
jgi:RNA polymerase sigma-70 factor (ECF subfamily)